MTTLIINIAGVVFIALIIWWFWLARKKTQRVNTAEPIDIIVDNGVYSPAVINAQQGETLQLRFTRKDATPCAEIVIFDRLDISSALPLNEPHLISIELKEKGEYNFTCQMGMYRGKVIVK